MKTTFDREAVAESVPTWLVGKMNRMTLIAGVVGSDGIVLAADQRAIAPSQSESEMDDTYGMRKIIDLPGHRVAYACVGDVLTASVGEALEESIKSSDRAFVADATHLQGLAKKVWAEMQRGYQVNAINRLMLIVDYREEPQLWRLNILGPNSHAVEVRTIAVAGSLGNTARFFTNYYEPGRTAAELSFLAAHIVLAGGRIEPLYVDGLDVAIFSAGGCDFLKKERLAEIRKRSIALDGMIRGQLYASSSASSQT